MPTKKTSPAGLALAAAWLFLQAIPCQAGRPLTVDDAGVNEAGAGHVEFFGGRDPGGVRTWTVAPAYGLNDWIEIGASASRDISNRLRTTAAQVKLQWTPSLSDGCNWGSVLGVAHTNGGVGNTHFVNGLFTCNREPYALHANLGATRARGGPALPTWGLALERAFGAVTAHVETFGQRHAKPVLQLGARTELVKNLQVDATLGRQDGRTLYSAGLKLSF